jgi:hypothetical protein
MAEPIQTTGIIAEPVAVDPDAALIELARKRSGNLSDGIMFTGRGRVKPCPRCGNKFVQWELSARFLAWVAAQRSEQNKAEWEATVSENALPLLCLPCERRDLGAGLRPPPTPTFGYGD